MKPDIAPQVIYNGIDTQRFDYNPSIRTNPPYVVGTVGRITPIKDTLTYIRAARDILRKYPAKFYIVGRVEDEEYYDECRELIDTYEIQSQVFFTGFQESSEWYPRFDVFVLPSLSEGLPLTLLEAMSSGVPCVATDVGGTSEILDDAFLVEKWNPGILATKITSLLNDPDLRKEISVEVRKAVEDQFTKEKMIEQYRRIYEELA